MQQAESPAPIGRVASLHLHPPHSGDPLTTVEALELIAGKGIQSIFLCDI